MPNELQAVKAPIEIFLRNLACFSKVKGKMLSARLSPCP
jgi:hypothetical protein